MQNSKKNTTPAPDLRELQETINEFFSWNNSEDAKEHLFDIYSMSKESPLATDISPATNAEQAMFIKTLVLV